MPTDDESFSELASQLVSNMVVAFSQDKETGAMTYDVVDVDDPDIAIAMCIKGLFLLVLDTIGVWEPEEMSVEIDDSDEYEDEEE